MNSIKNDQRILEVVARYLILFVFKEIEDMIQYNGLTINYFL